MRACSWCPVMSIMSPLVFICSWRWPSGNFIVSTVADNSWRSERISVWFICWCINLKRVHLILLRFSTLIFLLKIMTWHNSCEQCAPTPHPKPPTHLKVAHDKSFLYFLKSCEAALHWTGMLCLLTAGNNWDYNISVVKSWKKNAFLMHKMH